MAEPTAPAKDPTRTVLAATFAASLVVGTQVASKAARDALFLSAFEATHLPKVMLAAAALSLTVALGAAPVMRRLGPFRVLPPALVASGALFVGELVLASWSPAAAAFMLYLHVAALGGVLVSAFWSLVGERFDPHRARKAMGRIGTGATLGGVLGGIAADLAVRVTGARGLLVTLTVGSVLAAFAVDRIGRPSRRHADSAATPLESPFAAIRGTPHLRSLAALGVAGAVWAAFFDYGFKSHVAASVTSQGDLVTFFGWYYTLSSLATLAVQSLAGERLLTRYGLSVTVAVLPVFVAAGGVAAAMLPLVLVVAGTRGVEASLANSVHRSGYELFFTPLPRATKRAAKTLVDVAAARAGDGLGSALVLGALALWPAMPVTVPFAAGSVVALFALVLVPRLHRGYVDALEAALRTGVVDLPDHAATLDATTRRTLTDTTQSLDRERLLLEIEAYRAKQLADGGRDPRRVTARSPGAAPDPAEVEAAVIQIAARDPRAAVALALLSGDEERMRATLEAGVDPALARMLVPLLAHPRLGALAGAALGAVVESATGSLEDALFDRKEARLARIKVPALLAEAKTKRARSALMEGLEVESFELRLACGRALSRMCQAAPELRLDKRTVGDLVARSLELAKEEARSNRSVPPVAALDDEALPLAAAVTSRLDPVVLHALTLLAAAGDPEALALAARAIAGADLAVRGTALEYLENVVDEPARQLLLDRIGTARLPSTTRRSEREARDALLKTRSG